MPSEVTCHGGIDHAVSAVGPAHRERSVPLGWYTCRSCRARLDLHNNRRRKRGETGSETYRSSARLERRLGEQLHQRISTRARSRRSTRKARSDSSEVLVADLSGGLCESIWTAHGTSWDLSSVHNPTMGLHSERYTELCNYIERSVICP